MSQINGQWANMIFVGRKKLYSYEFEIYYSKLKY